MNRRGLLLGVGALLVAPSIVRASSLMPVSVRVPLKRVWHFNVTAMYDGTEGVCMQTLSGTFENHHQAIAAMRLPDLPPIPGLSPGDEIDLGWSRTTGPFWVHA